MDKNSIVRHVLSVTGMLFLGGIAYGQVTTKIERLEDDNKKLETLQRDVNRQAVTIAEIVINTNNIKDDVADNKKLLQRILENMQRIPPQ